jgi:hypothetical protein
MRRPTNSSKIALVRMRFGSNIDFARNIWLIWLELSKTTVSRSPPVSVAKEFVCQTCASTNTNQISATYDP